MNTYLQRASCHVRASGERSAQAARTGRPRSMCTGSPTCSCRLHQPGAARASASRRVWRTQRSGRTFSPARKVFSTVLPACGAKSGGTIRVRRHNARFSLRERLAWLRTRDLVLQLRAHERGALARLDVEVLCARPGSVSACVDAAATKCTAQPGAATHPKCGTARHLPRCRRPDGSRCSRSRRRAPAASHATARRGGPASSACVTGSQSEPAKRGKQRLRASRSRRDGSASHASRVRHGTHHMRACTPATLRSAAWRRTGDSRNLAWPPVAPKTHETRARGLQQPKSASVFFVDVDVSASPSPSRPRVRSLPSLLWLERAGPC